MQIQEECQKFARSAKVSSTCVFGGADRFGQQRELQRGNHLIVATPGRLLDFLESNVINLRRVTYLVLDEADRMLVDFIISENVIVFRIWDLNLKSEE